MSNSSSSSDKLVDAIADSFFTWIQNDILPVCMTGCEFIIIIVGVILNILLLVTFKKKGLFNEPSSHFVLMLTIVDFIGYVFMMIPNAITAIATEWILSDPVCEIHGAMIGFLMIANFSFLCVLAIERAVKLYSGNDDLHFKLFENKTIVNILTVSVWILSALIGFIPTTGAGDIKYDFYHQGCMLDYAEQPVFLIFHFILVFGTSIIIFSTSYGLIFEARRKATLLNRAACFKNVMPVSPRKTLTSNKTDPFLPTINENDDNVSGEDKSKPTTKSTTPQTGKGIDNKIRPKSSPRQSMLFEVFSDDEENPAFHLALTYLALWAVLFVCYLPYFTVWFYSTYNSGPLWGGFYTITLLVMHVSFSVKPIIYLGHNRHYRQVTKQTVPEAVRSRARSVRSSIGSFTSSVEDFVFKSNQNKQFAAALATQKAVLIWKKKLRNKQGFFKLKENQESNNSVSKIQTIPEDKSDTGTDIPNSNVLLATTLHQQSSFDNGVGRSNPATPSAVTITTSSFIEKERLRLIAAMDKTSSTTASLQNDHQVSRHTRSPTTAITSSTTNETMEEIQVPGGISERPTESLEFT